MAEIQAALERLRLARVRQFKWTILLSPLMGFCMMVIGTTWVGESLAGREFNLIEQFPHKWVLLNYAVGIAFIPLGYPVARVLASRYVGSRWWERLLDDIAGGSLRSARQELARRSSLEGDGAKG